MNLHGVITALITPFQNGEVDYISFESLLRDQMNQEVDGLVITGTTGESPTLSVVEVEKLFLTARKVVGQKIPLIVGTGSNSTAKTIEMTVQAGRWGADAALVVTPYYNKPPQRGLLAHFRAVADASHIPVILYNVPGRTITSIAPETVAELAKHNRIRGLKDATGDLNLFESIKKLVPKEFVLLSGDDPTCVEFCARGGAGVISVISHVIGAELKRLIAAARRGGGAAHEEYQAYKELNRLIYIESNPIPVKAAVYLMKLIASPEMRLPLVALGEDNMKPLEAELKRLGKIRG